MRKTKNGSPALASCRYSAKKMYKKVHEAYLKAVLLREDSPFLEEENVLSKNIVLAKEEKNNRKKSTVKKITTKHNEDLVSGDIHIDCTQEVGSEVETKLLQRTHKNSAHCLTKNQKKIIQEILSIEEIPFYPLSEEAVQKRVKKQESLLESDIIHSVPKTQELLCTPDGLFEDIRLLLKNDLFYLLVYGMNRKDMDKDWLFERCRDVQKNPNDYIDLWAREHYKSTIITIGLTIQNILNNPNITVGIFSHTRPIAKAFLRQIKREWETNSLLRAYFPHICAPEKSEARTRTWSEDGGLIVKRDGNPKEATLEAWGLVDGQPTGKHFDLLLYDDVVTLESVSTPEQIKKTTDAWRLSLNLGSREGHIRMIGTRYHATDTYHLIMEQGSVIPRVHPATKDGLSGGEAVFLDNKVLAKKRRDMGPYVFACQMLQNPLADNAMGFKKEWFQTLPSGTQNIASCGTESGTSSLGASAIQNSTIHSRMITSSTGLTGVNHSTSPMHINSNVSNKKQPYLGASMNRYIVVDPASSKKEGSDYTSMWVIGLNHDGFYYVLDGVHDRLALHERADALFTLHRKHSPLGVGYEQYGIQADIEHIQYRMEQENYRFTIMPLGGAMAKSDRIRRLVPVFEQGRLWFPHKLVYVRADRSAVDLVQEFYLKEYINFPVAGHDDMLDCLSRILDSKLGAVFPMRMENIPQNSHNFFL